MAKIYENEKGFKVIEVTAREMLKIGCGDICDHCGEQQLDNGYYVAVLNHWVCPTCFETWYEGAINYASPHNADGRVENRNFDNFKNLLGING